MGVAASVGGAGGRWRVGIGVAAGVGGAGGDGTTPYGPECRDLPRFCLNTHIVHRRGA
jgi:hypothetical protein